MEKVSGEKKFTTLLAALLAAWLLTGAGLLLLSVLMFRLDWKKKNCPLALPYCMLRQPFWVEVWQEEDPGRKNISGDC